MKKILVPTDFSTQAENALKVAAQLAKKHHCELYLLHILEVPVHTVDALSTYNDLPEAMFFMKLAQKRFEELKAKDYLKGLVVHEHVEFQEIFKGVFHVCKNNHVDLIVMGSNGANGLKEILIGSNTEKVVRTSEIPVLVIKKEHTVFKTKRFVFASDFKEESKPAIVKAIAFAKILGSKMHLLMVNTPNHFITSSDAQKRVQNFIKDIEMPNYSINIYNDVTIETGIMNFSQSIEANLVGMSTHGRQGLSHFFNGSISEDLVNHAKRPVITFKI
ncbi:nucleotide-binding universal stress UspA family protein [Mariniflexile fucanivorans]|uniref:Nucleotide-binding universal stress UspA family protein n=1 Tax=Mariniflexile fucanivorans TaxID=264023 RepID=A0A4R1RSX7_9FLAO|nr:universal stress protein [Mariniflexile fucanivorans]TCL69072.1 nucleotide-binding universal stress UspA family protein [Mariniflexile fucanivorans]